MTHPDQITCSRTEFLDAGGGNGACLFNPTFGATYERSFDLD